MSIDISDVTRRIQYSGSAGTGPYQFAFEILAQTDVAVYVDETLQTLTTNYTVTINGDGTGSITLLVAATGANTITIIGDRAIARSTDFVTGGDLLADSLNDELDSLTIYCQQLEEKFARCFAAPEYDTASTLSMPDVATRASKYLAFDAAGNPAATSGTTNAFVVTTFAETLLDDSSAAMMQATLGLEIGTNVQAYDADLTALAGLTSAANKVPMFSGSGTATVIDFKDEDNMASDSATAVPSQQSVKAYADTKTTAAASAAAAWAPKAWVRFNGTGTPAIVSSYNIASITDNGTGDYTINFTVAFANANYCAIGTVDSQIGPTNATRSIEIHTLSAGSARIQTVNTAGAAEDVEYAAVMFFGDQ